MAERYWPVWHLRLSAADPELGPMANSGSKKIESASAASASNRLSLNEDDVSQFESYRRDRAAMVERVLDECVAQPEGPAARLFEAMRYSLLAGGKRLRPVLALASCEAVGGRPELAFGLGCALEMIHTYSMIHDDLPCMDDDDLRRGKPANHKVFGEAFATLAGDGLLTDAFSVVVRLTPPEVSPAILLEVVDGLARAAGSAGMVAGQAIDLLGEGRGLDANELESLHRLKTGALFVAAAVEGGRLGGGDSAQLESLRNYASAVGLAFQVTDDLLDVESSTEQLGKRVHKDSSRGKATYPALLGVAQSHRLAASLHERAIEALKGFDHRAEPLRALARFAVERKR
jgi:geranylgeranyl diphosphate synthase type II